MSERKNAGSSRYQAEAWAARKSPAYKLPTPARDLEIARRYDAGETLGELGIVYDLSRERIRQIVADHRRAGEAAP